MGNLKSDWNFSATSLDLAAKYDQLALRIYAVDLKNEPLKAGALIKIKTCLAGAKISVEVADIKVEPIRDGAKTTLQDIFVVAKLLRHHPPTDMQTVASSEQHQRDVQFMTKINSAVASGTTPCMIDVFKAMIRCRDISNDLDGLEASLRI